MRYKITFKETGRSKEGVTVYETPDAVSEAYLVDFFGLRGSDIERYEITEL